MSEQSQNTLELNSLLTERQQSEALFHDNWAENSNIDEIDPDIAFDAITAIDNRYILNEIKTLQGKQILDLGCGCGEASVYFAKKGAFASACDISSKSIEITQRLAKKHRVIINAVTTPSENLPFESEQFDFVYGNGVLHHVDIPLTLKEVYRVLKPGGQGFFVEPMPYNPIINLYRYLAREFRTPYERPLNQKDIQYIRSIFPTCKIRYSWFFTLGIFLYLFFVKKTNPSKERYWKKILYEAEQYKTLFLILKKWDDFLLPKFPILGLLGWNMVIQIKKDL